MSAHWPDKKPESLIEKDRKEQEMSKIIKVLNQIMEDCEQDVKDFDGREFNGKTLGELHGILEATINAIARIVKKLALKIGEGSHD